MNICQFLVSFLKAQVSFPWNFASIFSPIKHNSSVTTFFSSNIIYFGQKEAVMVKICQIPHVNFEATGQFPCKFYITLQYHERTPLYLFSSDNIYFAQKEPIKAKLFALFECLDHKLSNSSCQLWNYKSIPLQILHHSPGSWKLAPLYFFNSNNIYFAQKEPNKKKIF